MIVLIPAYQPDEQLTALVDRFIKQTDFSILVVNDGSSPDKAAIFEQLPASVTLLTHEQNRGKGCAMKTGMQYIQEHFPPEEGVVVVDADGQHLLPDVLRICEELTAHPEALVLGSRQFTGKVPVRSKFGNTVTRYVFALASGVMIHDTQTGLRAFSVAQIPTLLALKGERYEYEMYMLLGAAEQHIPLREVFIETVYLDEKNSSSHFHPLRDSFRIYASILKFTCSSLIAFVIDYILVLMLAAAFQTTDMSRQYVLLISAVIALIVSSSCNFFINRRVVFKVQGQVMGSAAKYCAVTLLVLTLNYLMLWVFHIALHIPLAAAKLMVECLLFFVSLLLQRFFVFRIKKHRS